MYASIGKSLGLNLPLAAIEQSSQTGEQEPWNKYERYASSSPRQPPLSTSFILRVNNNASSTSPSSSPSSPSSSATATTASDNSPRTTPRDRHKLKKVDPYALLPAEKDGWLLKQRGKSKTWKKRYFILKDFYLYYFKDLHSKHARGLVDLRTASVQGCHGESSADISNSNGSGFVLSIRVSSSRCYFVEAEDNASYLSWLRLLQSRTPSTPNQ
ncbi:Cytohesin-1 [Balamuthia mandrillaris]